MKDQLEEVVSADGYGNTSEFFRDLFRDYLKRRQRQKLEAMLVETLERGDFSPVTSHDFEDIKNRGLARIEKLKQKS